MSGSSKKPNFLVIYPDTLGARAVGCYGNPIVKTPNIDALAATGVKFENCTSQNPVCCPSRMSLHTGKYVSAHGLLNNNMKYYPESHFTIPRFLKDQGYRTAYYGKTHSINRAEWDDIFDLYPHYNHYLKAKGIDIKYPERMPVKDLCHGTSQIPSKDWATNVLGNLGERFIHEHQNPETPFMLFMSFEAPHGPCTYPFDEPRIYDPDDISLPKAPEDALLNSKPYKRQLYMKTRGKLARNDKVLKSALAIYYSMVTLMDRNAGKLVQALDHAGLRDNTVIIFLSDHGDFMGNYNCVGKGMSVDQSLVHVPLIINNPARFSPRSVNALAESIDVFPTIAELTGAECPRGVQGTSLLAPALDREHCPRQFAFTEEFYGNGPHFFAVRNDKYKYILSSGGNEELYDLENDPWEWNDLSAVPGKSNTLKELNRAMLNWRFRCIDKTRIEPDNYIDGLLKGQLDKLPAYLGGTKNIPKRKHQE